MTTVRRGESHRFVLGIISLGTGIPITAIAATNVEPGLFGVIAAWAGIVGVNAVFAWGNRRKTSCVNSARRRPASSVEQRARR